MALLHQDLAVNIAGHKVHVRWYPAKATERCGKTVKNGISRVVSVKAPSVSCYNDADNNGGAHGFVFKPEVVGPEAGVGSTLLCAATGRLSGLEKAS